MTKISLVDFDSDNIELITKIGNTSVVSCTKISWYNVINISTDLSARDWMAQYFREYTKGIEGEILRDEAKSLEWDGRVIVTIEMLDREELDDYVGEDKVNSFIDSYSPDSILFFDED